MQFLRLDLLAGLLGQASLTSAPRSESLYRQVIPGETIDLALSDDAEQRWSTALLSVNRILEDLPLRDDYKDLLNESFATAGSDSDQFQSRVISLAQVLRGPGLQLAVKRRSGDELSGASGAYTPRDPDGRQRIYINANWLSLATSVEAIQRVLLEEVGHAIDQWLNGPLDARGDEGALFAALVHRCSPG